MALRDWNNNGDKNDFFDNMMDYKLYEHWKKGREENEENNAVSHTSDEKWVLDIVKSIIITIFVLAIWYVISEIIDSIDEDVRSVLFTNLIGIPIAFVSICLIVFNCVKSKKVSNVLVIVFSIVAAVMIFLFSLYRIDVFKNWNVECIKDEVSYTKDVFAKVFPEKTEIIGEFKEYEIKSGDIKSSEKNQEIYYYVLNDKFDELTPKEMGEFFCELNGATAYQDNSYLLNELWKKKKNIEYIFLEGNDEFLGKAVSESKGNKLYYLGIKSIGNVYSAIIAYEKCIVYKNYEPLCIYDEGLDRVVLNGSTDDNDNPFEKYRASKTSYTYNAGTTNNSTNNAKTYNNSSSSYSTYKRSSSKSSQERYDKYDVYDYSDPEDFYDDNYDDFESYEDAEDYYDEAWGY